MNRICGKWSFSQNPIRCYQETCGICTSRQDARRASDRRTRGTSDGATARSGRPARRPRRRRSSVPPRAQVADEVPVQRGLVLAAGLGVRAAEREVDGAADLLVEEDRADRRGRCRSSCRCRARRGGARRRRSAARAGGSPRRARRARRRRARRGTRSSTPATSTPAGDDGTSKRTRPFALVSCGPVKTSPRGHVALAVGVDPRAALDAQRHVGARGLDAQLARAASAAR